MNVCGFLFLSIPLMYKRGGGPCGPIFSVTGRRIKKKKHVTKSCAMKSWLITKKSGKKYFFVLTGRVKNKIMGPRGPPPLYT